MTYSKNLQGLQQIINALSIEECDLGEIVVNDFATNVYFKFKVYDACQEDHFHLGCMLAETFGTKNLWIDTYSSTPKYRGYTQIEIAVNKSL